MSWRQLILRMSGFSRPALLNCRRNRLFRALALVIAGVLGLGLKPGEPASPDRNLADRVVLLSVDQEDFANGVRLRALRQFLLEASEQKARALVVEIESGSGYDPGLASLLLDDLVKMEVPMHAYVRTSALGLGALLALGCDSISLHPASVIGGATPTLPGKVDDPASTQILSELKARARGLATLKGHPASLAESFLGASEVVTLTAAEATDRKLAARVVKSSGELISALGLGADVRQVEPQQWANEVAIPKVSPDSPEEEEAPLLQRRDPESYAGKVIVMEVGWDDLIAKARFQFMERVLTKARQEKPVALIVEMDTPGGYALETSRILRPFQDLSFPTFTFVNTHAESAGSLIALATDHIYMYPSSTIGSALVVTGLGEDLPGNLSKKVEAMTRAEVRNIALAKGHNPDVAEAFVTTETELIIDGVVICQKGKVLNLNAVEATRIFHGKPLLAKGMARSVEDILQQEGLKGEIVRVQPSALEAFAQWVQLGSAILIAIGLAGAYTELNAPGFGLPGIVSVVAFSLFFFGNYVAGNMAGYETAVVFVVGLALVIVDIFLFPGTFVAGIAGLVLMVGALGVSMVDRHDFDDFSAGGPGSPGLIPLIGLPAFSLSMGLILTLVLIGILMRFLPGFKPFRWLVLQASVPQGTSVPTSDLTADSLAHALGEAITDLRPTGKARIAGEIHDVTTAGEFVERGTRVQVIRVFGDRIMVSAMAQP